MNGTINQDLLATAQSMAIQARADKAARKARRDMNRAIQQFQHILDILVIPAEVPEADNFDDLLKRVDNARNARKGAIQAIFTFRDNLPMGDVAVEADIRAQWVRNGWKVA